MKRIYSQKSSMFTSTRYVEFRLARTVWLMLGFNPKHVALGFSLDRYQLNVDLLFFWVAVEF